MASRLDCSYAWVCDIRIYSIDSRLWFNWGSDNHNASFGMRSPSVGPGGLQILANSCADRDIAEKLSGFGHRLRGRILVGYPGPVVVLEGAGDCATNLYFGHSAR